MIGCRILQKQGMCGWALGEPRGTGEFVPCRAQALPWMGSAHNRLYMGRKASCWMFKEPEGRAPEGEIWLRMVWVHGLALTLL